MAYFRELGANCSGGGSVEVISKYSYTGGTTLPNSGSVENIYWNTSLTMEEVSTIIQNANLTYVDFDGLPVYGVYAVFSTDGTTPLSLVGILDASMMVGATAYAGIDLVTNSMLFCTSELLAAQFEGMGLVGWNPDLVSKNGNVSIVGTLLPSLADMGFGSVGAENDKLINLFSASKYTKTAVETMPLSGTYDSNNLTITNNQNIDIKNSIETNKIIPLSIAIEVPDKLKDRLRGYLTDISPEYLEEVGTLSSYAFAGCDGLGTVVIPSAQIGSPINAGTFMYSSVENVIIPEGITGIDNGAFAGCSSLENINIPASVAYIGTYGNEGKGAFESTPFMRNITFAQGSQLSEIYKRAFAYSGLEEIKLPENLTEIGSEAFYQSGIRNITIPSKVTVIPQKAFAYCRSLETVVIPNSVTFFSDNAFEECANITSVNYLGTIDEWASITFELRANPLNKGNAQLKINGEVVTDVVLTIQRIGKYAFNGCTSLTSITMPSNASLNVGAFQDCTSLVSITMPRTSGIASIPEYVFSGCTSLASITIPDYTSDIDRFAFSRCTSLTSITMPRDIREIGQGAFEGQVIKLFDFRKAQQIPHLAGYGLGYQGLSSDCKIVVPDALYDYWIISGNWATYASYIVKASEYTE